MQAHAHGIDRRLKQRRVDAFEQERHRGIGRDDVEVAVDAVDFPELRARAHRMIRFLDDHRATH
jgi:hypothetical protein